LFLDEITETRAEIQVQLLRVLETGQFTRVGGEVEIEHQARLVSATNQDPAEAVANGSLREDLYFRLCVFPIKVPPLRDRMEDLEPLARHFLDQLNQQYGTGRRLTDEALTQLRAHHWPGNIRELKHTIHRSFIMAEGDSAALEAPMLFDDPLANDSEPAVGQSIEEVEKQLILSTLHHYGGDKKAAAATLGVSLKTLYNRLKNYEKNG
jgi:DNA-binding NtrC family response regulator